MHSIPPIKSGSITPPPIPIKQWAANPDLGAIRPYVPGGSLTAISVLILARSQDLMILRSALKRSRPAEYGEPRIGVVAFADSFLKLTTVVVTLSIFSKSIKYAYISVVEKGVY